MKETIEIWNRHYQLKKAQLSYPDENLVRLLKNIKTGAALDLGCGSGRHISLLHEIGFSPIYGADLSDESLNICRRNFPEADFLSVDNKKIEREIFSLPLPDKSLDVIVLWGVLHYNPVALQESILAETKRILKKGGYLLGTIRARNDTHLKENRDIGEVAVEYYNENEVRLLLKKYFDDFALGYMERSPIGELSKRICHWIFRIKI